MVIWNFADQYGNLQCVILRHNKMGKKLNTSGMTLKYHFPKYNATPY